MNLGLNKIAKGIAFFMLFPYMFTACREKDPKVLDLKFSNLQINSLTISKKNDDYLKNIAFSIDQNVKNTELEASIYNKTKIEYKYKIDSVHLNIDYQADFVDEIWLAKSNSNDFKKYDPKKDSVYIGDSRDLIIKLIPKKNEKLPELSPRIYKLKIDQFTYDSETIDYEVIKSQSNPKLLDNNIVLYRNSNIELYTSTKNAGKNIRYILSNDNTWSTKNIEGIPNNETIKNVVYIDNNRAYALTNLGNLYYQVKEDARFEIVPNIKANSILGYFTIANTFKLNLVVLNNNTNKYHFASFDGTELKMGVELPQNFPVENYNSFTDAQEWAGNITYLLGGVATDNSVNKSLWYTSNGTDWLRFEQKDMDKISIKSEYSTIFNKKIYRLIRTTNSITMYDSEDNGLNWKENKVALPKDEFNFSDISAYPFVCFAKDGKLYILASNNSANKAKMYIGKLRRDTN